MAKEWWKHLRPFNKRVVARAERRAAKWEITDEMVRNDEPPTRLGLHNDPKAMALLKKEGERAIPPGGYCYGKKNCPFWDKAENLREQNNGYCWWLMKGDWDHDMDLLWDQVKSCGVGEEEAPAGTLETL